MALGLQTTTISKFRNRVKNQDNRLGALTAAVEKLRSHLAMQTATISKLKDRVKNQDDRRRALTETVEKLRGRLAKRADRGAAPRRAALASELEQVRQKCERLESELTAARRLRRSAPAPIETAPTLAGLARYLVPRKFFAGLVLRAARNSATNLYRVTKRRFSNARS